jgi:hypothetical protein
MRQLYRLRSHVLRETGIIDQPGHAVTQDQQHTLKDVRCKKRLQFLNHRLDLGHESIDHSRDSGVGHFKLLVDYLGFSW